MRNLVTLALILMTSPAYAGDAEQAAPQAAPASTEPTIVEKLQRLYPDGMKCEFILTGDQLRILPAGKLNIHPDLVCKEWPPKKSDSRVEYFRL